MSDPPDSNFEIFESALYLKSVSMPLSVRSYLNESVHVIALIDGIS